MQVPLLNQAGEEIAKIELRDDIFGIQPNTAVMHQALVRQNANARLGTHQTKTRGEVRGGGKKPWKQKGTGRARQGSTRAPHWKGGGVVFGPHPRSYEQRMPKKMRRLALRSALAAKAQDDQIKVLDAIQLEGNKTREMCAILSSILVPHSGPPAVRSALILMPEADTGLSRAAQNLAGVKTLRTNYLNVRDLLGYDIVVLTRAGLTAIERYFDAQNGSADAVETETAGKGDE